MRRSPWTVLAVLALSQFMVVLDVTIVNVALPDIERDLGFSPTDLTWVIGAYTLVFGGFLLLGGRAGDLVGRRRMFVAGLLIFGVTSLAAGLADSPDWLIGFRAAQGLGGALLSPAAFSLLTVTFAHGRDRNLALGIWGGLGGLGGTLGVILGGALVDAASWRLVFLVNVPVVALIVAVTPLVLIESSAPRDERARSFDLAGAVVSTLGLLSLMLGVIRAEPLGWGSAEVVTLVVVGAVLLVAFVAIENRSAAPLVPMQLFRNRGLTTSSLALGLNGAAFLAMFFLTAIYLQQVRELSALRTGVYFLPMGVAAIVSAVVGSQLVTKVGTLPVQSVGSALSIGGLALLAQAGADGGYATHLLPGLVLFGIGIIGVGVPANISAVADVEHHHAGAASGVVTAGYQIGGALGLAVITTLSTSHAAHLAADGSSQVEALVGAFRYGLLAAAAAAALTLVVTLASPRIRPTAEQVAAATVGA